MLMITITADLAEMALGFVDGGLITAWLINPPVFMIVQGWLALKGLRGVAYMAGSAAEFIPFVNIFPLRTGGMIGTIIMANNPKLAKIAGAAKGKITSPAVTMKTIARVEGPAA